MLEELFELELRVEGENADLLDDISLSNLRKYKYASVDLSPTSKYVLNPFWTWVAQFMPGWLAPNCITLIGIAAIVLNLLLVLIYIPDFKSEAPRWVYFFFAFSLLFYQTMDNVDGKQARRTGTSSPLGELFDHGIDSLNCCWAGIVAAASMGLGSTWLGAVTVLSTTIAMYYSTWETYYTHTLFLGYLNGPTEGLLVAALAHCLSGLFGPSVWDTPVAMLNNLPLKVVWSVLVLLSVTVGHIPACVANVRKALRRQGESSLEEALQRSTLIWVLALAVTIWLSSPDSTVLRHNHLFMFGIACSFTFGRVTTAIILSHLCCQPFPTMSFPLVFIYAGNILYGILPRVGLHPSATLPEYRFLQVFTVVATVYFFAYSKLVIDKLTTYLGISAFTVKPRLSD